LASLMPPPFPFTPFVAAAAAFQYSRFKLLAIVGATRFVRFGAVGLLAVYFGESILAISESPPVWYSILALVAISIAGSAMSIVQWIKRSRRHA
ncbi:MAG: VTT domain-containing protein, partial [Bryobacteraceae bacterium]